MTWPESLIPFVADTFLLTTVVAVTTAAGIQLCRRNPAGRHAILLCALGLMLLCPWLAVAASVFDLPVRQTLALPSLTEPRPSSALTPISLELSPDALMPLPGASMIPRSLPSSARQSWNPGTVMLGLWAAGILFGLLRLVWGLRTLRQLRQGAMENTDPRLATVLSEVRRTLDHRELPPVLLSENHGTPVVVGFPRPVVLLPSRLLSHLAPNALQDVLVHECAHAIRHDMLVGWLQRFTQILFWPHPLVHWLNRALSLAREQVCDNFVLQRRSGADYAETLLRLSRTPGPAVLALHLLEPRWSLEQRVSGLLDKRRSTMTRPPRGCSLLASMLLIGAVATAASTHSFARGLTAIENPPDISGAWRGAEWGDVQILDHTGTYTDTYADGPGVLQFAPTGRRTFSGFWRESNHHGGTLEFSVSRDGQRVEGWCLVSQGSAHRPGYLLRSILRQENTAPGQARRAHALLAELLQSLGRLDEAQQHLQKAADLEAKQKQTRGRSY